MFVVFFERGPLDGCGMQSPVAPKELVMKTDLGSEYCYEHVDIEVPGERDFEYSFMQLRSPALTEKKLID